MKDYEIKRITREKKLKSVLKSFTRKFKNKLSEEYFNLIKDYITKTALEENIVPEIKLIKKPEALIEVCSFRATRNYFVHGLVKERYYIKDVIYAEGREISDLKDYANYPKELTDYLEKKNYFNTSAIRFGYIDEDNKIKEDNLNIHSNFDVNINLAFVRRRENLDYHLVYEENVVDKIEDTLYIYVGKIV